MKRVSFFSIPASAGLLFLLNACVLDKDKTNDEVVDPAAMGASLNGGSVYMSGWEQSVATSVDSLPSTSTSMSVALSKVSALGKIMTTAANTVTVDSSTKASGYVTVAVKIPGLLGLQITYDTAVVKYDAKYADNIQNNENIRRFSQTVIWQTPAGVPTGASDRAEFSDADGDSLLNAVAVASRVKVVFTHVDAFLGKALLATGTVVVGPGADVNFNTGTDNVIHQAAWSRSWGGRTDSLYFMNNHGSAEIVTNDTLHLFIKTTSSIAGDTLSSRLVDITFNPGSDLKASNDDLFYSIHVTSHKRGVFERDGEFTFTPSAPVLHGQAVQSGSFSANVTFSNGKSASLEGTFSSTGYQAIYTGPDGVVKTVQYTKAGAVTAGD